MRSLQDEIRRAQRELTCPVCGRTFEIRDINLRLLSRGKAAELSASCSRGHFPVVVFVPVAVSETAVAKALTRNELKAIEKKITNLVEMAELFKEEINDEHKNDNTSRQSS